ncbi:MAG: GAF domain-containing protein [Planctomycetota bacterium]
MTAPQLSQPDAARAEPGGGITQPGGLSRRDERQAFLRALLRLQCETVGGEAGLVVLRQGPSRQGGVAATYEDPSAAPLTQRTAEALAAIGARAGDGGGTPLAEPITIDDATGLYAPTATHTALAVPLRAESRVEGAAVVLARRGLDDSESALETLGLTTAKFEAFLWRQSAVQEAEHKLILKETLELLDRAQQGATAAAMASVMCDELRRRFACTRVSIGLLKGDHVRIVAISGAEDLDAKSPAVEALEGAMEEAALQDAEVHYPLSEADEADPAKRRVIHEHARLSEAFGPSAILSLPLRLDGGLIGSMVLERDPSDPFPPGSLSLLRLVAEFVGPAVHTRRLADRRAPAVLRDDAVDLGAAIVGPRHTVKKLIAGVVLLVIVLAAIVPIPARISAPMELRATVSRAIVPPFAGYLASSAVRPGDGVAEGDLLAVMATDELELNLAENEARRETLLARRDDALARGERSTARQIQAEIDEVTAGAGLLRERLEASELRAPITGVISQGDLERLAGAPVDASQILLEVVGEGTTAILEVPESSVDRVKVGQAGWISARGEPGRRISVEVVRINPVAQVRDARSVYLVEARITDPDRAAALRPGMTGSARLRAGWSTTLWELGRPVVDALRMRLWW